MARTFSSLFQTSKCLRISSCHSYLGGFFGAFAHQQLVEIAHSGEFGGDNFGREVLASPVDEDQAFRYNPWSASIYQRGRGWACS